MDRQLQGKFHAALLDGVRGIRDVSEKVAIATIVLAVRYDGKAFAELLYGAGGLAYWHGRVNAYFRGRLSTEDDVLPGVSLGGNEESCFRSVVASCRKIFDGAGYYKALHEGDAHAAATYEVCRLLSQMQGRGQGGTGI